MGSCCSSRQTATETISNRTRTIRSGNFIYEVNSKTYSVALTSGEGIRRCPVWRTRATKEELLRKREEFWETRTSGDPQVWLTLRRAVEETESVQAIAIVEAAGLRMRAGMLISVIDEHSNVYELPPYIISEPESFGTGLYTVKNSEIGPERSIHIKLRCAGLEDMKGTFSNHTAIDEVKETFSSKNEIASESIKLFYNGKELRNGYKLGNFDIADRTVVQVFCRK